jgi:hypothetical protein
MRPSADENRGRALLSFLTVVWLALAFAAIARGTGVHGASAPPPVAPPAQVPPIVAISEKNQPVDVHAQPASDHAGSVADPTRKQGIRPPWHENWIPELRHQPGQKKRSATA